MGKQKQNKGKDGNLFEFPSTPLTPAQAESQRILSNMPEPDPLHGINYEWTMKDLQNWSKAEQELRAKAASGPDFEIKRPPKGPMTFGGRVWWSAAARLCSIVILFVGIIAESLIILRDASVRIADLPLGETNVIEAEATERRLRFARDLTTSARSQSKEVVAQQSTNAEAALTNTSCQWVQDTDVLNNGSGITLAVTYHIFTTVILAILVMAEFKIWTYRLHPSSTMNIGIIQLWAGLAGLSRSVSNTFDTIAGYCLIVAGLGNILSGFFDRWAAGGPGFMFFGTGIAPAKQVPHGSAPPATMPPALGKSQTNGPAPPDPLQELIESEKIAGLQSAEGTTEKATDQNRVLPDSLTPGNAMPPQPAHHHYDYLPVGSGLAKPLAHQTTVPMPQPWESSGDSTTMPNTPSYAYPPGTGMKPMLDYLASADPAAYTDLLSEVKKRDKERKRSRRSPADGSDNDDEEEEERPRRVYFSDSGKTHHHRSSKAGKKWKNRMTHVI